MELGTVVCKDDTPNTTIFYFVATKESEVKRGLFVQTNTTEGLLIGRIEENGIKVRPEIISKSNPICVESTLNAVTFSCAYTGQHTLIGRGAGGKETAISIIRDLIDISEDELAGR